MHIFLMEDEVGLCRLLHCALEASRHVVDVVPEGEMGLAATALPPNRQGCRSIRGAGHGLRWLAGGLTGQHGAARPLRMATH